MAELKTRPTDASVADFLDAIEPEQKRRDSRAVAEMMERISGNPPVLWGPSIVGFGSYTYTNTTGKPADWPLVGFSPRKANLVLYIVPGFARYEELLENLGKHSTGKSCLYIKKLADIDLSVLEDLIGKSLAHMRAAYPTA